MLRNFTITLLYLALLLLPGIVIAIQYIGNISESVYLNVTDDDGSIFSVKRIPSSAGSYSSCYDLKRGTEHSRFCYPSINVVGVGKCGTSALYMLFANNPDVVVANKNKEYCPTASKGKRLSVYSYLKNFPDPELVGNRKFVVNGCLVPGGSYCAIQTMLAANAASLLIVRSLPDREWAAHNYWCNRLIDNNCYDASKQVLEGMYRSPIMFDEMLRSARHNDSKFFSSCERYGNQYAVQVHVLKRRLGVAPLVIASEALSNAVLLPSLLLRIEAYLFKILGNSIKLRVEDVLRVNTGNHHGAKAVEAPITEKQEGGYAISDYKPMLDTSREFLMHCWKDCKEISILAEYPYNCTV